jgi:alkanesulfonate monooxygenase SsuD/methylene tetrahydromethanopterin reductase-like flavin-dependent oxidoreductase (luciferase family)
MSSKPIRFGVNEAPGRDTPNKARQLGELGFDVLLAPDRPQFPSPLPLLAAAAAVTESIGLGTYVLAASLHEPAALVRQLKAVLAMAEDRFQPGFGAGLEPGSGAEKRDRLQRLLEAVRAELPDLRVLVAASGKATLELAARYADTVALSLPPAASDDEIRDRIEVLQAAAGGRAAEIELNYTITAVGDQPMPWLEKQGLNLEMLRDKGAASVLWGDSDAMCEQLLRRRDVLGITYWTVSSAFIEPLATVVAALKGR